MINIIFIAFLLFGNFITVKYNGKKQKIHYVKYKNKRYVSLNELCKGFSIKYEYSSLTNCIVLTHLNNKITIFKGNSVAISSSNKMVDLQTPPLFKNSKAFVNKKCVNTILNVLFPHTINHNSTDDNFKIMKIKLKKVIIDAGHGGKDSGASNKKYKAYEKKIVLDVALELEKLLKKSGIKVVMTRNKDVFIPLEKRVKISDDVKADLFVSIHANAHKSRKVRGSEVYIFNLSPTTPESSDVVKRENIGISKVILKGIIKDLKKRVYDEPSIIAAACILNSLKKKTPFKVKRRILRGPFFVLSHTNMPAVLIEVAYITNKRDVKLLKRKSVRKKIAKSICDGILSYKKKLKSYSNGIVNK